MKEKKGPPKLLSTSEVAGILGISRVSVFKRIKSGRLAAHKVGGTYVVEASELKLRYGGLTPRSKRRIRSAVRKVLGEYGDVIRRLGSE